MMKPTTFLYKACLLIPCHRRKERCLHIKGKQMPICTRCFAILLGHLLIPLFFIYSIPFYIGFLLQIPMIVDGYTQLKKWRTSNHILRFLTGVISGAGLSILIVAFVRLLTN